MRAYRTFTKYDLEGMEYRAQEPARQESLQDLRQRIRKESQKAHQMAAICNSNTANMAQKQCSNRG